MARPRRKLRIAIVEHHLISGMQNQVRDWARKNGHRVETFHVFGSHGALPRAHDFDLFVYMGGTPFVHQVREHPWIPLEQELMRAAEKSGATQMGICFGSQNLAAAFGGGVHLKRRALRGWYPVVMTRNGRKSRVFPLLREPVPMLYNHANGLNIPGGALVTLRGQNAIMGFEMHGGRTVGILVHPEATPERLVHAQAQADNLDERHAVNADELRRMVEPAERLHPAPNAFLTQLLDNMVRLSPRLPLFPMHPKEPADWTSL